MRKKPKKCEYCGATYHQPYEDGLVECRNNLKERVETLEAECAQMSGELGLPPTIRPAEGELRRMMRDLGKIGAALRHIRAYREGVVRDPNNVIFRVEDVLTSELTGEGDR